ncbi:MAG TPA: protein kinase [Gemmatimonas sp.]|nr:protein kinase [Gemmatimonas sp.]
MATLTDAALVPEARSLSSRYEFLSELGRGGMGIVYLARERAGGRAVAIKLLSASHAANADAALRFAREARTVAGLHHPNIVRTLGIEALDGGAVAIVSEYVDGQTLRGVLHGAGVLPFARAAAVLRDVAAALAHAHEHRIVHRDVKPDNIFIEAATGRALLSDFGIARPLDADTQLTIAGASFGTPAYMAPEQVKGASLDERADVYSLGLVGWEMLTGARPWEGETLYEVLHKQQHERLPSLASLRPDIPSYLLVAIEGALAKAPGERWANGAELLQRLTPVPATLPSRRVQGADAYEAPTLQIESPPVAVSTPPPPLPPLPPPLPRAEPGAPFTAQVHHTELPRVPDAEARPAVSAAPAVVRASPRRRRATPRLLGPLLVAVLTSLGALFVLTGSDLRRARDAFMASLPWARPDAERVRVPDAPTPVEVPAARRPAAVRDSSNARLPERPRATPPAAPRETPRATPREAPRATPPVTPPVTRRAAPPAVPRTTPPVARRTNPSTRVPARTPAPAPARSPAPRTAPPATATADARCSSTASGAQRACLLAAIDRNDASLNRTYQELIAQMRRNAGGTREPPAVQSLRVEQRAWVVQRDRACGRAAASSSGGLWAADRVSCFARMSDSREAVLRRRVRAGG